jgi:peptide methionine sulfoxide reductase MsrA
LKYLKGKNYEGGTEITKAGVFYKAEEYHQSITTKRAKMTTAIGIMRVLNKAVCIKHTG